MARILLAWELGGGRGHVERLLRLAERLQARGHAIALALRHPERCGEPSFPVMPAPHTLSRDTGEPGVSLASTLLANGFSDADTLKNHTRAWIKILQSHSADLLIADHGPTALLAARCLGIETLAIGTGFSCPPDQSPTGCYLAPEDPNRSYLKSHDQIALQTVNGVLAGHGRPALTRLSQLYHRHPPLLTTFPELDHFGARPDGLYTGPWQKRDGAPTPWPSANGPRILIYGKPTAALIGLLRYLKVKNHPVLAFLPEPPAGFSSDTQMTLLQRPMHLGVLAENCSLAVLNGTHATTAACLLAGVPTLQIPIFQEQYLLSQRVWRMGAGLLAPHDDPEGWRNPLEALLNRQEFTLNARAFARRHAGHRDEGALDLAAAHVEQVLNSTHPASRPFEPNHG